MKYKVCLQYPQFCFCDGYISAAQDKGRILKMGISAPWMYLQITPN